MMRLLHTVGNIFLELKANGRLYPLNSIDEQLLNAAMAIFTEASEDLLNTPLSREIDNLTGDS